MITVEEYERAKNNIQWLTDSLQKSIERKNQLLDQLVNEREAEKRYRELLQCNEEIIMNYEFRQEVLREESEKEEDDSINHSKWEISFDGYYPYCLECGYRPDRDKLTDYCPKCGSRMDGGENA